MAQQEHTFCIRITAEGNATLPKPLLELLKLSEGDFIKIIATASKIIEVRLQRGNAVSLFSPEIRAKLDEREKQFEAGHGEEISDLTTLSKRRAARARTAHAETP